MLLRSTSITHAQLERGTGWRLKPEGACKGDQCITLPAALRTDPMDVEALAEAMGLPIAKHEALSLYALGPESIGSRALTTADAPEIELPDLEGHIFNLSSLRGQKVVVYAWAPY